MSKLACRAALWYNEASDIVALGDAANIPSWINLYRRLIVDILSQKTCSKCGNTFPATPEFFYPDPRRKKDGLKNPCKACHRAKASISEIRDRRLAYMKAYRQTPQGLERNQISASKPENKEKKSIRDKARRGTPEYLARQRTITNANYRKPEVRERIRAKQQIYANSPEARERKRAYEKIRQAQPGWKEQCTVHRHARRARLKAAPGRYTAKDIRSQYERQKGKCYWCSEQLPRRYHVDHIVPLSRGGSNWPDNIVLACPACNCSKQAKLPHEFFKGGRLL